MKNRVLVFTLALLTAASSVVFAGDDAKDAQKEKAGDIEQVNDATVVIQELAGMKEGPPRDLLKKAQAVVVVPGLMKASLVVGGEHGDGLLLIRNANGSWGQPLHVNMSGGSVGFQAGVSSTDLVLIFMRERNVNEILDGEFTVGGEAGVAAGPLGRQGSAGADVHFDDAIYSYSRSKGVFAGISVEGSKLSLDKDSNARMYPGQTSVKEISAKAPANGTPEAGLVSALNSLIGQETATGAKSSGSR